MLGTSLRSFIAGLFIGLAASIYLKVGGIIGSLLFAVGLIGVIVCGADLFTGKLGFIKIRHEYKVLYPFYPLTILTFNALGILIASWIWGGEATSIVETRLSTPLINIFWNAIGCGILMSIAVISSKRSLIGVLLCVSAFILAGFPHCIADMYYYALDGRISWAWLLTVIGNWVGCAMPALIYKK